MKPKIQFIKGLDEKVLPEVKLTRSRDGSTGTATFRFKNPNILDKSTSKEGEITGMYLIDQEGILETRDVNARFLNGKPEAIEAIYIMKNPEAWDRFMRFMERYDQGQHGRGRGGLAALPRRHRRSARALRQERAGLPCPAHRAARGDQPCL